MDAIVFSLEKGGISKMKKKKWSFLLMMVIATVCLSGCSSIPKEEKIKEDIVNTSSSTENLLSDGEKIVSVEIKDRQTDKKQKYDHVICTVKTEKDNVSYEKEVSMTYYKYDNGWSMQEINVNDSDNWIVKPLKGVSKEQIIESLESEGVDVDGEWWNIESGEISQIAIKSQDTNLEKGTDKVTVTVNLSGEVENATGTVKAEYKFDKEWELESMKDQNDFKSEENPDKALNMDENGLIQALKGYVISVGEKKNDIGNGIYLIDNSSQQEIEINPDDISEFSINNQEKIDKGTWHVYECSCKLSKSNVSYTLQIEYGYGYDGEWLAPAITVNAVLDAGDINLSGKWTGTYNGAGDKGKVELNITSDDGKNYSGTYTYTPNESYGHEGSYEVSGTFNSDTMQLKLTAGEWVSKSGKPDAIEKQDISAIYYVDRSEMKGTGQMGYIFDVTK